MAIDIERILNKIMDMAEQKQKAQGYDAFGSAGAVNREQLRYNDLLTKAKWEAIDKKDALRDTNATQLQAAQLAHPASSLDAAGRAAYANAAVGKMDAEAEHYKGSGAQGQGIGAYQSAKAATENSLREATKYFTPFQKYTALSGQDPFSGTSRNSTLSQPANNIATPSQQDTPSYTNETVNVSPQEQALLNDSSVTQNSISTDNQKLSDIFEGPARGAIAGIDGVSDLANYFGNSAKSFRRNLKNSNFNVFAN